MANGKTASDTANIGSGTANIGSGTANVAPKPTPAPAPAPAPAPTPSPTAKTGERIRELHDNAERTPEEILENQ